MSTTDTADDVIDSLVGITRGSHLDALRARRPAARENAQNSYRALFEPEAGFGNVTRQERLAVALFVAALHGAPEIAAFYEAKLRSSGGDGASAELIAAIRAEVAQGAASGPYGQYPAGPLSREDAPGPILRVSDENRRVLGARLAAALEHAHMLVFRPRDSAAPALHALAEAGWSTTDIVTLSQLVAFLTFQIRVVSGLRVLASSSSPGSQA